MLNNLHANTSHADQQATGLTSIQDQLTLLERAVNMVPHHSELTLNALKTMGPDSVDDIIAIANVALPLFVEALTKARAKDQNPPSPVGATQTARQNTAEGEQPTYEEQIELLAAYVNLNEHEFIFDALTTMRPNNINDVLYIACVALPHFVEPLIKGGADVNTQNAKGQTPLHMAASCNQTNTIETLIANRAIIDQTNREGNSALHLAALYRQFTAVDTLIDYSPNTEIVNLSGNSALSILESLSTAHQHRDPDLLATIERLRHVTTGKTHDTDSTPNTYVSQLERADPTTYVGR